MIGYGLHCTIDMSLTLLTLSHCSCTFGHARTPPFLHSRVSQDAELVQQATDLVTLCLRADPSQRPSMQQIIAHPFLAVSNLAQVSGFGPGGACVCNLNRTLTHVPLQSTLEISPAWYPTHALAQVGLAPSLPHCCRPVYASCALTIILHVVGSEVARAPWSHEVGLGVHVSACIVDRHDIAALTKSPTGQLPRDAA